MTVVLYPLLLPFQFQNKVHRMAAFAYRQFFAADKALLHLFCSTDYYIGIYSLTYEDHRVSLNFLSIWPPWNRLLYYLVLQGEKKLYRIATNGPLWPSSQIAVAFVRLQLARNMTRHSSIKYSSIAVQAIHYQIRTSVLDRSNISFPCRSEFFEKSLLVPYPYRV